MTASMVVFYLLAALASTAALSVVLASHPVRAAFSLILCFIATAGLWLSLHSEFLALSLVLLYVGAVMVLFLFVIMMLDIKKERPATAWGSYLMTFCMTGALAGFFILMIQKASFDKKLASAGVGTLRQLAQELFERYLYPFEIAGVLLLVAIVAAIEASYRGRRLNKAIDPGLQLKANKQNRLRILKFPTEPGQ